MCPFLRCSIESMHEPVGSGLKGYRSGTFMKYINIMAALHHFTVEVTNKPNLIYSCVINIYSCLHLSLTHSQLATISIANVQKVIKFLDQAQVWSS